MEWTEKPKDRAHDGLELTYSSMGWALYHSGRFDQALRMFQKVLQMRERQGRPAQVRGAKWCVAKALRALGQLKQALTLQTQLEAESAQANAPDGFVFEELGELYTQLGQPDLARSYFALAAQHLEKDLWLVASEGSRIERLRQLAQRTP